MSMKKVFKGLVSRKVATGMLRGVGGAVLAGVGWKIGSDIYDAVKKRIQNREAAEPTEVETAEEEQG